MDAVSQASERQGQFINLSAHVVLPDDHYHIEPGASGSRPTVPVAELDFSAEYDRSELFVSREVAERQAVEHNNHFEAAHEIGWLLVAQILKELDEPVQVQVRQDGQGRGTLEITRCYSFRLVGCSSEEASEATHEPLGTCS